MTGFGRTLNRHVGEEIVIHPSGDYKNVARVPLEKVGRRYYVGGVELPSRGIDSALPRSSEDGRKILDLEINPGYFTQILNELYLR